MTNPTNSAIAYILAQTQENIHFLRSVQQISPEDERDILAKISSAPALRNASATPPSTSHGPSVSMPLPPLNSLSISTNPSPKLSPLARPPPPIPTAFLFKARANWAYNADGKEPQDLQFSVGDIIEVTDDKNSDWWKGRLHGREGLFPSSYVEALRPVPPQPEKIPPMPNGPPSGNMYAPSYQYPQQQQPPQYGYNVPPQGGQYPAYPQGPQGPPPAPVAHAVGTNEEEHKKKPGFLQGKLGNTLAHSAVGGVGFGAGSAIGGGIINSIF